MTLPHSILHHRLEVPVNNNSSLPEFAGSVAQLGYVPWEGHFGWRVTLFRWQKIHGSGANNILKHAAEILSLKHQNMMFSALLMPTPLYKKDGKLTGFFPENLSEKESFFSLEFPYP